MLMREVMTEVLKIKENEESERMVVESKSCGDGGSTWRFSSRENRTVSASITHCLFGRRAETPGSVAASHCVDQSIAQIASTTASSAERPSQCVKMPIFEPGRVVCGRKWTASLPQGSATLQSLLRVQ